MALEAEGSTNTASEGSSSESTPAESTSSSGYSATDPGYEAVETESTVDDLEALRAENTKAKPSETLDDASETDGDTEESEETPTDDSADDEISDELIDRALALDYTIDELKAFPDQKSLEKEVARVEKIQQRLQARQAGTTPADKEAAPEEKPEPNWDELIELGHDPDMIALQKENWQEARNAKAQVQQLLQAEQDRALIAQSERFDETLNKLEGFEKVLGTGRKSELGQTEAANRQKVFTKMEILRRGYELAGQTIPAESDLIQEAVHASFYKQAKDIARKQLTKDIRKAGSQALSRPRSAEGKPLSGPSLAAAKEAEFWKKHS